jgi:uncharacterized protein (TIGR03067 family)
MKLRILGAMIVSFALGADDAKDAKELEPLQGDWQLVSATRNGKAMPDDMVKATRCTVKGNKFTITREGKAVEDGTLKLDGAKKPKEIDMNVGNADAQALGIYELDKDNFKLCYGRPGKDRPKEFAAKEGDAQSLSVWKRRKD